MLSPPHHYLNYHIIFFDSIFQSYSLDPADADKGQALPRSDYTNPTDDLAFDMYQDPEVAQIIRKLDKKKQEAVLGKTGMNTI